MMSIRIDDVGGFGLGDSGLPGSGKHFRREDYWHNNHVGDGVNVHSTYQKHACFYVTETLGNLIKQTLNKIFKNGVKQS